MVDFLNRLETLVEQKGKMDTRQITFSSLTEEQRVMAAEAVARDNREFLDRLDSPVRLGSPVYRVFVRRIFDIIASGMALVVTLPINLILAICTYMDVGSPIFFRQERVGKDGKVFELVKFRNMTNETDENGVLLPPEERVTKWGRFVRKTSLDELLNFWCIFKGDMSLIGPRPLPVKYYNRYSKRHNQRHLVKPGLECPFHDNWLAEQGWKGRFENDIWYVEHVSFKTDILMMLKLVKKVFTRKERTTSAFGHEKEFVGYDSEGNIITATNIPEKYLYEVLDIFGNNIAGLHEETATSNAHIDGGADK